MHATRYPVLEMDADISIHVRSGTGPPGPPAAPSRDISIRSGGGLSAAAAAVDVVSAACGRGSGRVDVVV